MPKFSLPEILGASLLATGVTLAATVMPASAFTFNIDSPLTNDTDPGLSATLEFFDEGDLNDNMLFLKVSNTSDLLSTLTGFGFDYAAGGFSIESIVGLDANGLKFDETVFDAELKGGGSSTATFDIAGTTDGDLNGGKGQPGTGLETGEHGTFKLNFDNNVALSDFSVSFAGARFQSVGPDREDSGKVVGRKVPEPTAMAGLAVVALAGAIKRRQAR